MAIEHILKRIEEETEETVRQIFEKAEADAASIRHQYADGIQKLKQELDQRAQRRAEEEERRLIVNEQLELRKALLARKREILEDLYAGAKKKISSIAEDQYLGLLKDMIIARSVSGTEEIVVPDSQKDLFTKNFLDSLNKTVRGGRFTLTKEPGDFSWGVVLREGKRVVNLTLDVLFEQLKEKVEPEIAALLFPEEE